MHLYALLSGRQLKALIAYCQQPNQCSQTHVLCVYSNDMYMAKLYRDQCAVDDTVLKSRATLLLFAACTIILHGLSQSTSARRGNVATRLDESALAYHVDATLF